MVFFCALININDRQHMYYAAFFLKQNARRSRNTVHGHFLSHLFALIIYWHSPSFRWDVKARSWLSVVIKNPMISFEKIRGMTSASRPNLPIGLWHHGLLTISISADWFHHSLSSPPVNWCVVGVLAHYGCRRIIQVDAAQWWWMRRHPLTM